MTFPPKLVNEKSCSNEQFRELHSREAFCSSRLDAGTTYFYGFVRVTCIVAITTMKRSITPVFAAIVTASLIHTPAQAEEPVDFVTAILPVFEAKCMDCHRAPYENPRTGRITRPKGSLRMDTVEELMKGGDEGMSIVKGKPDESLAVTRVMLPEHDDDHMPPEGNEPLTDEEKAALRLWIEQGADFGEWTESKFDPEGNKIEG
jgi:uncharacterized membrane protein